MKLQHLKFILLLICLLTTININAISDSSTKSKDLIIANTNNDDNNSTYFTIRVTSSIASTTASSIHVIGHCEYETNTQDEVVLSHTIALYKKDVYDDTNIIAIIESQECNFMGLEPNTQYWTKYIVTVISDGNETYGHIIPVNTPKLTLTTSQPQVISNGNVIVSAETNIDDAETNIGFEWRRTDWTDDFASNRGEATLRNGIMEGYIFNLNTEKLWKYRPYYISNSGTYYYGEWVGIDPTNTPNDEPTIYTDETSVVEGNTAIIKGYTSIDTGQLESQGFKYWKVTAETEDMEATIPMNAATVETSGQMMTANLTGLDYNSTYHYVAFVTTIEGETLYGEVMFGPLGDDPTGIEDIQLEPTEQNSVAIVARYNMSGQPISSPQKGINILRMSNGTVKKVLVK